MKEMFQSVKSCWKETLATPLLMIGEVLMEVLIPYIVSVLLGFLYIINQNPAQAGDLALQIYEALQPEIGDLALISFRGNRHRGLFGDLFGVRRGGRESRREGRREIRQKPERENVSEHSGFLF